jgi:bifunctional non-homologous end joining protein LigD
MFVPPMLATRLRDPGRLDDARYAVEPKLDGQRAQIHVVGGRTVAVYSRPGRELLALRGLAWLRDLRWPMPAAILDGELFHGNGADGIDSVFAARAGRGDDLAFAAFDLLATDGRQLLALSWDARRSWLEQLLGDLPGPRVQVVPLGKDAHTLWQA